MALSTDRKKLAKVLKNDGLFAEAITHSDSKDLDLKDARIYVGTGGHIKVDLVGGNTITLKNVSSGTFIDYLRIAKVWARGTTASDIVAIY